MEASISLLLGLGAGSVDAGLNSYVSLHFRAREMSFLHAFWGLGTTVGPFLLSWCFSHGFSWNHGYRAIALLQGLNFAILLLSFPLWRKADERDIKLRNHPVKKENPPISALIRKKAAIPAMIGFFGYCGAENTAMLWSATFLVEARGLGEAAAASAAGLLFWGITAGRIFSGIISNRMGDRRMLNIGECCTFAAVALLLLLPADLAPLALFFLGGNWAYVQRYTSVSTPRDARKVGYLFGALYLVSPILWMLPPMIYRVVNPSLEGLEAENAYLLMCKEAMPSGLLGLMLGGMIFATASSLNATLNISAGVFTNDIFKRLSPSTSERGLMRVARWSTIAFGVLAIVVALLIPLMGGIVNVVISVAALTGVPLYLPLIWTLFSRNLNGRVILTVTIASLAINALFKFITPLAGFSLDRAQEMLVGVLVPALLLAACEIRHRIRRPDERIPMIEKGPEAAADAARADNRFSVMVIGIGAILSGLFVAVLGALADEHKAIPLGMGLLLLAVGTAAYAYSKKKS